MRDDMGEALRRLYDARDITSTMLDAYERFGRPLLSDTTLAHRLVRRTLMDDDAVHDRLLLNGLIKDAELVAEQFRSMRRSVSDDVWSVIDERLDQLNAGFEVRDVVRQRIALAHYYDELDAELLRDAFENDYPKILDAIDYAVPVIEELANESRYEL